MPARMGLDTKGLDSGADYNGGKSEVECDDDGGCQAEIADKTTFGGISYYGKTYEDE